jgi:hypothetical protein
MYKKEVAEVTQRVREEEADKKRESERVRIERSEEAQKRRTLEEVLKAHMADKSAEQNQTNARMTALETRGRESEQVAKTAERRSDEAVAERNAIEASVERLRQRAEEAQKAYDDARIASLRDSSDATKKLLDSSLDAYRRAKDESDARAAKLDQVNAQEQEAKRVRDENTQASRESDFKRRLQEQRLKEVQRQFAEARQQEAEASMVRKEAEEKARFSAEEEDDKRKKEQANKRGALQKELTAVRAQETQSRQRVRAAEQRFKSVGKEPTVTTLPKPQPVKPRPPIDAVNRVIAALTRTAIENTVPGRRNTVMANSNSVTARVTRSGITTVEEPSQVRVSRRSRVFRNSSESTAVEGFNDNEGAPSRDVTVNIQNRNTFNVTKHIHHYVNITIQMPAPNVTKNETKEEIITPVRRPEKRPKPLSLIKQLIKQGDKEANPASLDLDKQAFDENENEVPGQEVPEKKPVYLGKLVPAAGNPRLIQGDVWAVSNKVLMISDFTFDGDGPDAFFWVGPKRPSEDGVKVPSRDNCLAKPLGRYNHDTVVLELPYPVLIGHVQYLAVWVVDERKSWASVQFPANKWSEVSHLGAPRELVCRLSQTN